MKQIETKYRIKISVDSEYGNYIKEVDVYPSTIDFGQISKNNVLACIYQSASGFYQHEYVSLYYNENGYSEKELRRSGYSIVLGIKEIHVYEEENEVYTN